ncbi:hypothetical protein DVH24_016062 [Malus domestica]|uniref:Uncharacterized protein n=1 Tax=Malus domestica TaxID=3750 RepID=A0A498JGI8_MALDO|nr:hypothetical protein DVH24_016062 [Malus domestica]
MSFIRGFFSTFNKASHLPRDIFLLCSPVLTNLCFSISAGSLTTQMADTLDDLAFWLPTQILNTRHEAELQHHEKWGVRITVRR